MSRTQWVILLALLGYYTLATAPFIGRSPRWNSAEVALIAPAHQLATTGIYGNPIYRDFHRTEQRNYEFMPLHPLQLAATIKLFGLNPTVLRLLSFANGFVAVILLFSLTRRLHDVPTALVAVAALVGLRLGASIPHVDLARIVHYDILVPVWILTACLFWERGRPRPPSYSKSSGRGRLRSHWFLFGICAGIATLAHVYGAFVLAIPFAIHGWRLLKSKAVFWIGGGWLLAILPFLLYIAQDIPAYRGQMSRHSGRFDLLNWQFYANNLRTEQLRFTTWFADAPLYNVGLWILIGGVVLTHIILLTRIYPHVIPSGARNLAKREILRSDQHDSDESRSMAARFTLVSLGAVWLPLALLISFKRYAYVTLLMPFFALQIGFATIWLWRRSGRIGRIIITIIASLAVVESAAGLLQDWRQRRTTVTYQEMAAPIAAAIATDATVIGVPLFWLGLPDVDFVGLDLAFVDSDTTATLNRYAPDYLLVQDHLLYQYWRDPTSAPRPELVAQWDAVIDYIEMRCAEPIMVSETIDYGKILLARCNVE